MERETEKFLNKWKQVEDSLKEHQMSIKCALKKRSS